MSQRQKAVVVGVGAEDGLGAALMHRRTDDVLGETGFIGVVLGPACSGRARRQPAAPSPMVTK